MGLKLAIAGNLLGSATLRGSLYDAGHYPVLVSGDDEVRGDLYTIPERYWDELDKYEEALVDPPLYIRRLTPVKMTSGPWLDAWAYWYNQPVEGLVRITSGDWLLWRP